MEWHDSCVSSSLVTTRYATVPPLEPFPIVDCSFEPGLPSFDITGWLPQLPDDLRLPAGRIPDRAELWLSFIEIRELSLSGFPDLRGGRLQISRQGDAGTRFRYDSATFHFEGICDRAVIAHFRVSARHDPEHREPRGPRLFSHVNVWNSCLLLLREYGYTLKAVGWAAARNNSERLQWRASTPDGADLRADSPIELLGLATLHRHQGGTVNEPYWWRIDGPPLVSELIDQWQRELDAAKNAVDGEDQAGGKSE